MRIAEQIEWEGIRRWLGARGLASEKVNPMPDIGFVNRAYLVGDEHVLRITKTSGDDCDAYTESVAVPVAVQAGLKTPELLVFDDSKEIIPSVVTLYRRVHGHTLGSEVVDQKELPDLYRELGEQLGVLHREVKVCPDPHGYLDAPTMLSTRHLLTEARRKRKVEAVSHDWISKWLDLLEPALETCVQSRFLHDDLHSFNTMVKMAPLRLSAIIDWGDAGWGDPALEFGTMPLWACEWVLQGYERTFEPVDEGFHGRLLWHDLGAAIEASINGWTETDEPWQPLTTSRWVNLTRFFVHRTDSRWTKWLPRDVI